MENKMLMPAYCTVLTEEEMTYTDGGATMTQALCAWFVPFYGWYKGITAVRDYRRANKDNWIDTGLDAYTNHIDGADTATLLYDVACAVSVVSSVFSILLPIDAIIVLS